MNKKIITLLIILLFSVSMVSAEDNATEEVAVDDAANYIMPVSISQNGIKFSDGFTGFSLDGSDLTTNDGFTQEPTGNDNFENYIKLAIIECYKQSRENDIGKIIASFCDGSYKNSNDEVITAVLESSDQIKDTAVVELNDGSKATFDFELLKSAEDKSDCLAYTVSIQQAPQDSTLGASNSDVQEEDVSASGDSDVQKEDASVAEDAQGASEDNNTSKEGEPAASGESETEPQDNNTQVNETNNTIVNKTNTVIIHEKNTTIITKNNVKNNTPEDTILKTAGNPLFLLVVVIILIAVVVFVKYRKG